MKTVAVVAVALAVAGGFGCAHQAGEQAAKGAAKQIGEESKGATSRPEEPVGSELAADAVRGGLQQLSRPEQMQQVGEVFGYAFGRATRSAVGQLLAPPGAIGRRGEGVGGSGSATEGSAIEQVADQAATAFAAAFARETVAQLGEGAEGPLAGSLSATAGRISGSAFRGASEGLGAAFPECSGPDREECINRRVSGLSRAASAGVADAVMDEARPWLLVLTAALAAMFTLAVVWGIAVLRRLRPPEAMRDQRARG